MTFPSDDVREKEALKRMGVARTASTTLQDRSVSPGSGAGGFLETMAGAMTDPINVVSMGFGACSGAGILRTALTEGLVGCCIGSHYSRHDDPEQAAD